MIVHLCDFKFCSIYIFTGLKKLVQPANHEKTTYEIVKHPHVQQSHSYSGGHGDFESEGGQYHRSLGSNDMLMQDRAYRGHLH